MIYSSLVLGAMVIFSVGYYAVYGRKAYMGPVVEIEVEKEDRAVVSQPHLNP